MGNVPTSGGVFLSVMGKKRRTDRLTRKGGQDGTKELNELYDLSTPLWDRYYRRVRSSIKFPRYYRSGENW